MSRVTWLVIGGSLTPEPVFFAAVLYFLPTRRFLASLGLFVLTDGRLLIALTPSYWRGSDESVKGKMFLRL